MTTIYNSGLTVSSDASNSMEQLTAYLTSHCNKNILVLCIGTDKCIGDCLAPLVGSYLKKRQFPHPILGTLDMPVHALNMETAVDEINSTYPDHFIVAVDACIGEEDSIGAIQIRHAPISPGKGVGKTLPQVGHLSIVGIVDSYENSELFTLRSIRLGFVMKMAEIIAEALISAYPS